MPITITFGEKRGLCLGCQACPESVMHVIRDCEDVREFWYSMLKEDHVSWFFTLGLECWMYFNLSSLNVGVGPSDWSIFFGIAAYELWWDRNLLVFSNTTVLGQGLRDFVMNQVIFVQQATGLLSVQTF